METATVVRAPGLLEQARELVAELSAVGFEVPAGPQEGLDLLREVEVLARRVRSLQLAALDAVDESQAWRADGHRSVRPMVAVANRLSGPEELRRVRCARALRELPWVAEALREGRVGACQAERISRTWANPRVREAFLELDAEVAAYAARASYPELDLMLRSWEAMVDEEGTADRGAANHTGRDAGCEQRDDGGWSGEWRCGSLDGAQLRAILDAFARAELEADRDVARAANGGEPVEHRLLERTDAQRRFDALARIFSLAADAWAAEHGGAAIETIVVIDEETFSRHLARLAGHTPAPRRVDLTGTPVGDPAPDLFDLLEDDELAQVDLDADEAPDDRPVDLDDIAAVLDARDEHRAADAARAAGRPFHSRTIDGHWIDPTEAVANALTGHVRRAVLDAASVTIDLGRRQRLFTGHAALAARLAATTCYWPGCRVPASRCQTDHLEPWAAGGATDQANAGPGCGRHNRHKEHGYRVRRERDGTLRIDRPDGTRLC